MLAFAMTKVETDSFVYHLSSGIKKYEQKTSKTVQSKYIKAIIAKEHGYFYRKRITADLDIKKVSEYLEKKGARTDKNKHSSAYGYGQFLNSTWRNVGVSKTDNGVDQVYAVCVYVNNRSGTAQKAWEFHLRNNWY